MQSSVNEASSKCTRPQNTNNPLGIANFFSEEQFAKLEELMYPKEAEAGSFLFREGDPVGKVYYIRSGKVKLKNITEDGKQFIVSILQTGDFICEPDRGTDAVHSLSAEVIEHSNFGVIEWKELQTLLFRHGDFAVPFMNWMMLTRRVAESKFRDLLLFGKPGALASTLIRLANCYGVLDPDGIRLELKLTHVELAEMIGTTREGVSRMLNGMKQEGIIDIRKGHIVILSLAALRKICQCPECPPCPKELCRI